MSPSDLVRAFRQPAGLDIGTTTRGGKVMLQARAIRGHELVGTTAFELSTHDLVLGREVELNIGGPTPGVVLPTYEVFGHVREGNGRPIPGAVVQLRRVQLAAESPVGEATADAQGAFSIGYLVGAPFDPAGPGVPLLLLALDPVNGDEIDRTELICSAPAVLEVDLVRGGVLRGPSIFEQIDAAVRPHLERTDPRTLDDRAIEFLLCVTTFDVAQLTAYLAALRFAADVTSLPAALFFALLSTGTVASLDAVAATSMVGLDDRLRRAADQNLVPTWTNLDAVVRAFANWLGTFNASPSERGTVGELLATVQLGSVMPGEFVDQLVNRTGTLRQFWDEFRASAPAGDVATIDFALSVGRMTSHTPLLAQLVAERQRGTIAQARDLAGWQPDRWATMLADATIGVPEFVGGRTPALRRQIYAEALSRTFEVTYPTEAMVFRLAARGRLQLAADYVRRHPEFDFRGVRPATFVAAHPPAVGTNVSALRRELELGKRLFQISPRVDRDVTVDALLQAGVVSAHQIATLDLAEAQHRYGAALGEARTQQVWNAARRVSMVALNAMVGLYQATQPGPRPGGIPEIVAGSTEDPPDLRELFGTLDYCLCKHCRSVLGPAAYLTHLLRFLEQNTASGMYPALLARRPEIIHILLDCRNAETPLPTIDLVNEILERHIIDAHPNYALTQAQARPQTTWTSDELRAHPEHLLPAAYDILSEAHHPWILPFDLRFAEVQVYLERLGLRWSDLVGRFAADGEDISVIGARVGVPAAVAGIIVTPTSGAALDRAWGTTAANLNNGLAEVFLARAGIELPEFEALRQTRFLGNRTVRIDYGNDPCQLDGAVMRGLVGEQLSRWHRFARLQRALGWSPAELDHALLVLGSSGSNPLDAGFLTALAGWLDLHRRFSRPTRLEFLGWFGRVSAIRQADTRSLFDQIFIDPGVGDSQSTLLAVIAAEANEEPLPTFAFVEADLAAALRISASDLALVRSLENVTIASVEVVSRMYGWASLARELGVGLQDLVTFSRVSGLRPFGGSPDVAGAGAQAVASLSVFLQAWDLQARAGFESSELGWLLQHDPQARSDDAVALFLLDLARGVQSVDAQFRSLLDARVPAGSRLEQAVGALLGADEARAFVQLATQPPQVAPAPGSTPARPSSLAWLDEALWRALHEPASEAELATRLQMVVEQAHRALFSTAARASVLQGLTGFGRIDTAIVEDVSARLSTGTASLVDFLIGPELDLIGAIDFSVSAAEFSAPGLAARWRTDDPAGLGRAIDLLVRFDKTSWVARRLELDRAWMLWLLDDALAFGLLGLLALPIEATPGDASRFASWARTVRLRELDRQVFGGQLRTLLRELPSSGALPSGWATRLAAAAGWPGPDLDALIDLLAIDAAGIRGVDALDRVVAAFEVAGMVGVPPVRIIEWVRSAEARVPATTANQVKAAVRAKFPADRWPAMIGELRDELRERQRDALVAYVIATDTTGELRTADDLLPRFLIDVQGAACQRTSRIVQATLAIQLLVQRVLMGLEGDDMLLSTSAARRWAWMKNYRVWQANREIFLYPENYLDPDWREDKSHLFRQFVDAVQQSELDEVAVERAFTQYAEGLHEIGDLRVGGIHFETSERGWVPQKGRLHVFAHTKSTPPKYFYRYRELGKWSVWEEVPAKLPALGVLPLVQRGRLLAVWPHVQAKAIEPAEPGGQAPVRRYADVSLALVERTRQGWSAERLSDVESSSRWWAASSGLFPNARDTQPLAEPKNHGLLVLGPSMGPSIEPAVQVEDPTEPFTAVLPLRHFVQGGCAGEYTLRSNKLQRRQTYPRRIEGQPSADGNRTFVHNHPFNTKPYGQRQVASLRGLTEATLEEEGMRVPVRRTQFGTFDYTPRLVRTLFGLEYVSERSDFHFRADRPFSFRDRNCGFIVWPRLPEFRIVQAYLTGVDLPSAGGSGTGSVFGPGGANVGGVLTAGRNTSHMRPEDDYPEVDPFEHEPRDPPSIPGASTASTGFELVALPGGEIPSPLDFRFELFTHPYSCLMVRTLRAEGIDGLLAPAFGWSHLFRQQGEVVLAHDYVPHEEFVTSFPKAVFDFSLEGAYSTYNWELFVHCPAFMAAELAAQGRFAEAQHWLHYIFNPQEPLGPGGAARFWRVKPFYLEARPASIDEMLRALAGETVLDPELASDVADQIATWMDRPFQPHALAMVRPGAYQKWIVMRYLDVLIAWGDHLFAQDSPESINEAMQIYILAAQLLGPPPRVLPEREVQGRSYAQIRDSLDPFNNALVTMENNVRPSDTTRLDALLQPAVYGSGTGGAEFVAATGRRLHDDTGDVQFATVIDTEDVQSTSFGLVAELPPEPPSPFAFPALDLAIEFSNPRELYFCIPPNEQLARYWEVVGDRLFKIRNCLNLEGAARELSLFAPRIDPGLLAAATAAGLDIASALSDLSAPIPHYRFEPTLALAKEVAADVRNFGAALLSALQSGDAEELAELRATHERALLDQVRRVKTLRVDEAAENIESLRKAKIVLENRRDEYKERKTRIKAEQTQYDLMVASLTFQIGASATSFVASVLALIPDFDIGVSGLGPHGTAAYGGQQVYSALSAVSNHLSVTAGALNTGSSMAAFKANEFRRKEEWNFQRYQAEDELERIEHDILAARIREQVAKADIEDHDFQRGQVKAVEDFLAKRYTNAELFRWLAKDLQQTYYKAYQLAVELAKRAERCYQFELRAPTEKFIQFGHWDNRRKGLLAGDKLMQDLRRLEAAHRDNHRREYELTKRVSLELLDPFSLQQLRETGRCTIRLDEALFDLDHPSHYMRAIKAVRVSVPTVAGPYTPVTGTLTLAASTIRVEPDRNIEPQAAPGGGQTRIALSHGQADAGLFEANLRDERYLPFEGKGVISTWALELPEYRQYDYRTISDVVLEIQYTAREGGTVYRDQVVASLTERLGDRGSTTELGGGSLRMWSIKESFPDAWVTLRETGRAELVLQDRHAPQPLAPGGEVRILGFDLMLVGGGSSGLSVSFTPPSGEPIAATGATIGSLGVLLASTGTLGNPEVAQGQWTIAVPEAAVPGLAGLVDAFVVLSFSLGGA